jgi:transketolase
LSHHQVIWVATHDSIGLGEDGPTHQPVETAIHLRAIPNLAFWRPADGNECSAAYLVALKSKKTPSVLSLSRQNLPQLENSTIEHAVKGGYVLHEVENEDLTIVSTGSEVPIVVEAAGLLEKQGIKTRVVSLPCWEVFDSQPEEYRLSVLRSGAPILSVEAYSVRQIFQSSRPAYLHCATIDHWLAEVQSRAAWSPGVGCVWSLPEGLRVVRPHRNQYVVLV